MDALVLEDVSKTFGAVNAVDGLSVRVPTGCIYGFLGPNGAGKTTVLRMIMNILYPDAGTIRVLGNPLVEPAKERIGYMPEERGLYRRMKLRTVLSYLGRLKGVSKGELGSRLSEWLAVMDLTQWADKRVDALSKGMQQKAQFIATVINDPELLILDEPFAGLDPVNLDIIKGTLQRMREEGKTIILSTHMMNHAEDLCDSILLINAGKKIVDAPQNDIRSQYESNKVILEVEGETAFLSQLPMVESVAELGREIEVSLKEDTDDQALLKALVGRVRVRTFVVKVPTLHEIFLDLVGQSNA